MLTGREKQNGRRGKGWYVEAREIEKQLRSNIMVQPCIHGQ
jgi:hypothetical protein